MGRNQLLRLLTHYPVLFLAGAAVAPRKVDAGRALLGDSNQMLRNNFMAGVAKHDFADRTVFPLVSARDAGLARGIVPKRLRSLAAHSTLDAGESKVDTTSRTAAKFISPPRKWWEGWNVRVRFSGRHRFLQQRGLWPDKSGTHEGTDSMG
ncbi:MAG TPA: hypothetical protein VN577_12385 [Terriglobales bacterium]|nr:hypothetical protein [Terriglobales bacterium]